MAGATTGATLKGYIADSIVGEFLAVVRTSTTQHVDLPAASNAGNVAGVTQYSTLATGDHVDVQKDGIAKLFVKAASPNIAVNDFIVVHGTSGMGKKATSSGTGTFGTGNAAGTFTATQAGLGGNDITVRLIDPVGNNQALSVVVDGTDVAVKMATDGGGAVTTTPNTLKTAWDANADAKELATFAVGGTGASAITVSLASPGLSVQVSGSDNISQGYLIGVAEEAATADGVIIAVRLAGGL